MPQLDDDGAGAGLRDHGARAERRRRLRGPARPRLRRVLRRGRVRGRLVRLAAVRAPQRCASAPSTSRPSTPGIHISPWLLIVVGAVFATLLGIVIGVPTLRLRGDYLAIVTLGFGEIIPQVVKNGNSFFGFNVTNGPAGLTGLDPIGIRRDAARLVPVHPDRLHDPVQPRQVLLLVARRDARVHALLQHPPARLAARARLGRDPRGRGRRLGDGHPADAHQDLRVRDRRLLRWWRRLHLRLLQGRDVPERLLPQHLDLHPLHGDPRRHGQRLGRAASAPCCSRT